MLPCLVLLLQLGDPKFALLSHALSTNGPGEKQFAFFFSKKSCNKYKFWVKIRAGGIRHAAGKSFAAPVQPIPAYMRLSLLIVYFQGPLC